MSCLCSSDSMCLQASRSVKRRALSHTRHVQIGSLISLSAVFDILPVLWRSSWRAA